MAFYSEIYGYICVKEEKIIEECVLSEIMKSHPIFRPNFSNPSPSKSEYYISFAGKVKFDSGEDRLWILPFEELLGKINFVSATVSIIHEESNYIMMYSYIQDGGVQKFTSKFLEEFE